ncbi:MAG: ATP-binding protein, partial [Pseudomonadota bacterium]
RWAMSYLPGPLTRDQISQLTPGKARAAAAAVAEGLAAPVVPKAAKKAKASVAPPVLPDTIRQFFIPVTRRGADDATLVYHPLAAAGAEVVYSSARYKVEDERRVLYACEIDEGAVPVDWDLADALELDLSELEKRGVDDAAFNDCPKPARTARNYKKWESQFKRWVRNNLGMVLYRSPTFKVTSTPDESERDFRIRLQQLGSEKRDLAVAKLRKKYASKINTLENRLRRAHQAIEREGEQAKQKKFDTAIAFGTAILGAMLGRKKISTTSASRMGSAMKSAGRMSKESGDVARAEQTAAAVKQDLEELQQQCEEEIDNLEAAYDAQAEELDEIVIKPKSTDLTVHFVGIAWAPHYRSASGKLEAAWDR